jgi:hypothetical protein
LHEVVSEPVLVFFPYYPRIFENFGRYPFISDLLPKSLFVMKLKLVARQNFEQSAPLLVPEGARLVGVQDTIQIVGFGACEITDTKLINTTKH